MSRRAVRTRTVVALVLVVLLFAVWTLRPDGMQAVHWWPLALMTPLPFLPFASLRLRPLLRPFGLVLALWLGVLGIVGEPSWRVFLPPREREKGEFRVVSLNCAGGTVEAAREAFGQGADLVFLQEVGGKEFVRAAKRAGYPFAAEGVDGMVFSRTPLASATRAIDHAAAEVVLGGQHLTIVSLRLLPPVFRLDLWNPEAWREYATDAGRRRARLAEILPKGPCLVGGDFNATNPRLVTDSRPEMAEAGRTVGRGWRGTGTNDFPVVWTDQLWGSPEVRWTQAFVRRTANSDHRMVVADFLLGR